MIAPAWPGRKVRTPQGMMVRNTNVGRPAESATENRPPDFQVRVKRRGKSSPRVW